MLLTATQAAAVPFKSTGLVNPDYQSSWDESTLSGTAQYSFLIERDKIDVDYVEIQFENDIFDFSQIDASDFTVLSPGGWTTEIYTDENGEYKWSMSSAGTGALATSLNDPIRILFSYVLLSADRYESAFDSILGWSWDEGGPWQQGYLLSGGRYTSYGSTSPAHAPEPTTLMLFGIGLIATAGIGRRKLLKR